MPVQPVSELIKDRSPYKVVDLPPTATSERWGYSRALRTKMTDANTIMPDWLTRKLYNLEPNGGMTEPLQIDRNDKGSRNNQDLKVMRGIGKIVRYSLLDDTVEVSDLLAKNSRSIHDGDAFVLVNTSPSEPFVVEIIEMPTLSFGETRQLTVASTTPQEQGAKVPNEFYDALAQLVAGHF
jgi:hypothetical protein